MLKSGTIVDWMNTWGVHFIFRKSSILSPWGPFTVLTPFRI